jgi:hypothetical protein
MENSEGIFDFDVEWDKKTWGHFNTLLRNYPISVREAVAQYLNDQARTYKNLVPHILGTRYTIRNSRFVNMMVKVKSAKKGQDISAQQSEAYTESRPTNFPTFTGWEEEIESKPREIRKTRGGSYRLIWSTARKGGKSGNVEKGSRLNPGEIPDSDEFPGRLPQFIGMMARKRQKTFILKGGGFRPGLYRFKKGESDFGPTQPEIEALQYFDDSPDRAKRFDWAAETRAKVNAYFPADYVWRKYLEPIVLQELRK